MMTQYRLYLEDSQRNMRQLESYFDQEHISTELSIAAKRQVLKVMREPHRVRAGEVSHLNLLPTSLLRAVRARVVSRHLSSHVFFGAWCQVDRESLETFCASCIEDRYYKAGDLCFMENEDGLTMLFVKFGALTYKPGAYAPEASFSSEDSRLTCKAPSVATEVAMWLQWVHLGTMTSASTTEVFTVKTDAWASAVVRSELSGTPVRDYAFAFFTSMKEPDAMLSDLTYGIDYHGLMFSMPLRSRVVLCDAMFSCGRSASQSQTNAPAPFKTRISRAQAQRLRDEVRTGKTCVGVVDQELVRFVFVVAMRVYKRSNLEAEAVDVDDISVDDAETLQHKRFLVKLGELSNCTGYVAPTCVLPGSKRKEQETLVAAMERVIDEDLNVMGVSVEWHPLVGRSETRTFKDSPTYGFKTMYSRTEYTGHISAEQIGTSIPAPREEFSPRLSVERTWCPRWTRSERVKVVQERVAEVLRGIPDVVVCDKEDRGSWYAWLSDEEFQALGGDDAKPILEQWIQQVARSSNDELNLVGKVGTLM